MQDRDVIVIGGGASGLNAAATLAAAGQRVILFEARDRLGGRIHTVQIADGGPLVELGAEFIHGSQNAVWEIVRAAGLTAHEIPDHHLRYRRTGGLENQPFWNEVEHVLGRLSESRADQSLASFLEDLADVSPEAKSLAVMYVEGFHAADAKRIGLRAVERSESAAEHNGGTAQYRIEGGYSKIVDYYRSELSRLGVEVVLNSEIKRLTWSPGEVEATVSNAGHARVERAKAAVVTLPLGVLQRVCRQLFYPRLLEKEDAVASLAMGDVIKVILLFQRRFWPEEKFGFIHADDELLPTWWSHEHPDLLTGWAGGSQSDRLAAAVNGSLKQASVATLSRIFNVAEEEVLKNLLLFSSADWKDDPLSCGAYSYTPAGMLEMPELLGSPVAGTLFFAGEATDAQGDQGTVHGALASGHRAAVELLETR